MKLHAVSWQKTIQESPYPQQPEQPICKYLDCPQQMLPLCQALQWDHQVCPLANDGQRRDSQPVQTGQ
jgi:hypothetical protein